MAKTQSMAIPEKSAPTIHLDDEEIKKFTGDAFKGISVGDTVEVSLKLKVVGKSEHEYDDGKNRNITLELVENTEKPKSNKDKAFETVGKKADF